MPKFLYTAKSITSAETKGGEIVAKDEKEAARSMLRMTAKINKKYFNYYINSIQDFNKI